MPAASCAGCSAGPNNMPYMRQQQQKPKPKTGAVAAPTRAWLYEEQPKGSSPGFISIINRDTDEVVASFCYWGPGLRKLSSADRDLAMECINAYLEKNEVKLCSMP